MFKIGFFPEDDSVYLDIVEAGIVFLQKVIIYHDINWILVEITSVNGASLNPNAFVVNIKNLVYPRYSKVFGTIT